MARTRRRTSFRKSKRWNPPSRPSYLHDHRRGRNPRYIKQRSGTGKSAIKSWRLSTHPRFRHELATGVNDYQYELAEELIEDAARARGLELGRGPAMRELAFHKILDEGIAQLRAIMSKRRKSKRRNPRFTITSVRRRARTPNKVSFKLRYRAKRNPRHDGSPTRAERKAARLAGGHRHAARPSRHPGLISRYVGKRIILPVVDGEQVPQYLRRVFMERQRRGISRKVGMSSKMADSILRSKRNPFRHDLLPKGKAAMRKYRDRLKHMSPGMRKALLMSLANPRRGKKSRRYRHHPSNYSAASLARFRKRTRHGRGSRSGKRSLAGIFSMTRHDSRKAYGRYRR